MLRVPSQIQLHQFESLRIQENTFVAYRSDIYPSKNDVCFEENAVIYVLEGEKIFSNSEQEVRVEKGDVLFIKRGYYLMSESINAEYKSWVFFFDEKVLKEFVANNLEIFSDISKTQIHDSILLKLKTNDTFGIYIESLMPYFNTKTKYLNQFLKLKVQELLLYLLDYDSRLKQVLFEIYLGQKADLDNIMQSFCLKPLTIAEIAKISGRSLSSFKREFLDQYGQSPGNWIRNKKLEHAAFLIKNNLANVEEAVEKVGYDNVSHFIKNFKAKYNITPHQFGKRLS